MNSIGKECNELKAKYDECFQVWFSEKFLKGDTNEDMCKPIFGVYKECVRVSNVIFRNMVQNPNYRPLPTVSALSHKRN